MDWEATVRTQEFALNSRDDRSSKFVIHDLNHVLTKIQISKREPFHANRTCEDQLLYIIKVKKSPDLLIFLDTHIITVSLGFLSQGN